MACVDCITGDTYTSLPGGEPICRNCYGDRANNPRNKNYGRTGYGCCTPVDVQAKVQALHDEDHRAAVKASGIMCDCSRCRGEVSDFVFGG
jgi:hypothetical protein